MTAAVLLVGSSLLTASRRRIVVTADKAGYENLPGVSLRIAA